MLEAKTKGRRELRKTDSRKQTVIRDFASRLVPGEYQNLKDSLLSAAQRGKDLLAKVRVQPPEVIPYNTLDHEDMRQRQQRQRLNANECSVRQMMQELVQHERNLDSFWLLHKER